MWPELLLKKKQKLFSMCEGRRESRRDTMTVEQSSVATLQRSLRVKVQGLHCLIVVLSLFVIGCKSVQHHVSTEAQNLRTEQSYTEDPSIEAMIKPFREQMAEEMDVVLGELTEELVKTRPNSNLGNWFTDILYEEANKMFFNEVDFAIQNYGGLRVSSLPAGPVTVGKIYELMPFENTLVVLDMEGKVLHRLLNSIAEKNGWPISKNLSFRMEEGHAMDIMIKGEEFDLSKTYRVAMPDYIADGGDQSDFLKHLPKEESGVFIKEIIIAHLEELQELEKPIIIDSEKRIFK